MPKFGRALRLPSVQAGTLMVIALHLVGAALFVRILQYSWVTDDAFITFRSVLNFVAGDGPVFNVGERVQSFTHPLWFLLLSIGGWLDLNLYFFAILLGLACSLLTIILLHQYGRRQDATSTVLMPIVALGLLAGSESFVSFGTSGLESSASYLLITAAVTTALNPTLRTAFYVFVALALANRFDSVFLLAPFVVYVLYADWKAAQLRFWRILLAFSPLFAWHAFSLVYYGFLFPNTKYVKVGARPWLENAEFGIRYLADSAQAEAHVWLVLILLSVLLGFATRLRVVSIANRKLVALLLAGIYLHIVYVVFIAGGDFMRGRFFTPVVLGIAIALLGVRIDVPSQFRVTVVAVCVFLFSASAWIGAKEHLFWNAPGVANERNFYKDTLALNLEPEKNYTNHPWARQARDLTSTSVPTVGVNGQRGYWIPRQVTLVDPVALTDAFIARLPVTDYSRTGHFQRRIPEEYLLSKTQHYRVVGWQDQNAEELYEKLVLVTESQRLFSMERLDAMLWLWSRYGI